MALAIALAACEPPARAPFIANLALDEPPDFSPERPGAETLGGKLHYDLSAVPKVGKVLVVRKVGPDLEVVEAIDSEDRQADIRRLVEGEGVAVVEPDIPFETFYTPGDADLATQWGLAKVEAMKAWDVTRGGPLVAVIDTGVDANHPDLRGQVVPGRDFVNGDDDPTDDQGHGTHVAGIIAAAGDNGIGSAGVAFGSKVLAEKVLDARGSGSTLNIVNGLRHAVAEGARVVNLSLGSPFPSRLMAKAVQDALDAGVVVVAAAGNRGSTVRNYPAGYPGVIAVGASTPTDARAAFSNHGTWVAIAAPGQGIRQTFLRGGYQDLSGTSMAAPHVAGAAALVLAAQPGTSPAAVRDLLLRTGDPVRGFQANPNARRLNVASALAQAAKGGGPGARTPEPASRPSPSPAVLPGFGSAGPSPSPTAPGRSEPPTQASALPSSPTPQPSVTGTPSPSPSPAVSTGPATPAPVTASPTPAPTPTPARTPSPRPTATPTPRPTVTPTPSGPLLLQVQVTSAPGTLTIDWRTAFPSRGRVSYGLAATALTLSRAATYAAGSSLQHRVVLADLRGRTTYFLRIHNEGEAGAIESSVFAVAMP